MRLRLIGAVMEWLYTHTPDSKLRAKIQVRLRALSVWAAGGGTR